MKLYLWLKEVIKKNGVEGQIVINLIIIFIAIVLTTINIVMM